MSDDPDVKYSLKEDLNQMAENDTPQIVNVPQGMQSLLVWAIGRFGTGIVGIFGCYLLYTDIKEDKRRNEAFAEKQITSIVEFRNSIETFRTSIENNTRVLDRVIERLAK